MIKKWTNKTYTMAEQSNQNQNHNRENTQEQKRQREDREQGQQPASNPENMAVSDEAQRQQRTSPDNDPSRVASGNQRNNTSLSPSTQ